MSLATARTAAVRAAVKGLGLGREDVSVKGGQSAWSTSTTVELRSERARARLVEVEAAVRGFEVIRRGEDGGMLKGGGHYVHIVRAAAAVPARWA